MWNKSCLRPGDKLYIVRGQDVIVGRSAHPQQVRVIVLFDGWILWTALCRDVGEALDIAEIELDKFLVTNMVA